MLSTKLQETMRRRMLRQAQAAIDAMRISHVKQQAECQAQIDECIRQRKLCEKRLRELG